MWKSALLLVVIGISLRAQENIFYVAPEGNDSANGHALRTGGTDGPLNSLPKALELARTAKPARIILANGRYELSEPVALSESDSGTPEHPLIISAAPGARPVISGGRLISGWKKDATDPHIWTVELPLVRDGQWAFHDLFVNGQRRTRARTPNRGSFFRIDGASSQEHPMTIKYHGDDLRPEWAKLGDVEVVALLAWSDIRMQIREVDEQKHTATLSGNPQRSNREANAQYWVENAREFLDTPGEWYLNAHTGVLYYWPEEGEDLTKAEVIAPALRQLVTITGAPGRPVHDIRFTGLTFAHTDWTLGTNGYADTQAAIGIHGDLRAQFAQRVSIENCTFEHLAGYAIELGQGCRNCSILRNELVDLGAGGIRIGETSRPASAEAENNSHLISDNHLHQLGRVYPPAVGILILQSGTNTVAHNEINDLYYTAISVGWNWGYQETPCRENIIEYNHLHDIGQGLLSDMGGIYTLGIQHGTVLRNNLIHDVNAFTYGGWGLYPDEGSTGIVLENNVVYRCKSAGFHQHYGRENIVRNNIFAFNRESQLMRTREEPHSSFTFTNNIVYFDSGALLGSNWSNDHFVMDYNLYWDTRHADDPSAIKFGHDTFAQWQARGHDQHSLLADPLFIAPAKFDFRLQSNSPALRLGFKPIDLSTVGIRAPKSQTGNAK